MGNPSLLHAGCTRPGLWSLRPRPGCRRCSAAASPGKRRAARTAGQSLLPAPRVTMEQPTSGPDRARGYSRGSGQDSGARGWQRPPRLLLRRLLSAATLPPPPPPGPAPRPSSPPSLCPCTFKAPRPSLKGTAGSWLCAAGSRHQAPRGSSRAGC